MRHTEERYISLLTDFGFKRIFGTAPNKELLIDFLNSMFDGEQVVKDVTYLNSEHVGDVHSDRKAIFDVYCENEKGEKFIVEMQNASQQYFKDRSLYYATFPIREQVQKGAEWNYELKHVYVVALLNYNMSEPAFAKGSTYFSGFSIIRCVSKIKSVAFLKDFTTGTPIEIFGTKCPSITST